MEEDFKSVNDLEPEDFDRLEEDVCLECGGSGIVEIMGGSESDDWGVVGTRPCHCQDEE